MATPAPRAVLARVLCDWSHVSVTVSSVPWFITFSTRLCTINRVRTFIFPNTTYAASERDLYIHTQLFASAASKQHCALSVLWRQYASRGRLHWGVCRIHGLVGVDGQELFRSFSGARLEQGTSCLCCLQRHILGWWSDPLLGNCARAERPRHTITVLDGLLCRNTDAFKHAASACRGLHSHSPC
jgi:hypothetical protein